MTRTWSLRRRVPQATAVIVGLVVLLLVVMVVSLVVVRNQGNEVIDRWDPAYQDSQNALAALVNQETALRGYALGRDEAFLEPYAQYAPVEAAAERSLRTRLAGDETLTALLDTFDERVRSWRTDVAEPAIARVRLGDAGVADDILSLSAKQSFDRIRAAAQALTERIDDRRRSAKVGRLHVYDVIYVTLTLGMLVMVAAAALTIRELRRSVLRPITDLVEQTRTVASGRLDQQIGQSGPAEIVGLGADVDAMRSRLAAELARVDRARARLATHSEELARSNADLEQFAYVASHDLSEPLRKVTNFCQLLERQYGDQLDDRARQYIAFMVDGAKRMQVLITDLLAFSRVGRSTEHFTPVDLELVLARALANLDAQAQAAGAEIHADPLPTVPGDPTLLTALLQNLVGNAIKYHEPGRPPRVRLTVRSVPGTHGPDADIADWEITVADNGIGIEPQYAERIFAIFQRLHLRDQYGGTGIGLALCRKIVDFHHGRIWLGEPDTAAGPDAGSRFVFTLPSQAVPVDPLDDDPAAVVEPSSAYPSTV